MNIGVDIRCLLSPFRTGVGEYTFELLQALFSIDHHNQYFLFANSFTNKPLPAFDAPNVKIFYAHYPNRIFSSSQILFHFPPLDELIEKKFNIKLDWFFSPHLNFTALSKNTKHLLTIHDLTFEFFPEFQTLKQQLWHRAIKASKVCQEATKIITPSVNTKHDLQTHYGIYPEKVQVLYPGLSKVFLNNKNLSEEKILAVKNKFELPENFVFFLGTIEPRKNLTTLIEGFEKYKREFNSDIYLIIAGAPGWKNNTVKDLIKNSPYRKFIRPIGYINDDEKPAVYRLAKIFIYPSFYEGFGFPVLEAMNMGTPVIVSSRSSLPEIGGDSTYLVNPHRGAEITKGMEQILSSTDLKTDLVQKGMQQSERFRWHSSASALLDILQK